MAAWTSPKTWSVGNAWSVADANQYIRDNFLSTRLMAAASAYAFGPLSATITTTPADFTIVTNMFLSAPAEQYAMTICVHAVLGGGSAGTVCNLGIKDQAGATISVPTSVPIDVSGVTGHSYNLVATIVGSAVYASGQNGFTIHASMNAGTVGLQGVAIAYIRPTTI